MAFFNKETELNQNRSSLSTISKQIKDNTAEYIISCKKHILFIVENSLVPLDTRVWSEALAAKEWGYEVTVLCPKAMGCNKGFEILDGINIYRHPWFAGETKASYVIEYITALVWEIFFCIRIYLAKPFHIIHGANPPDHLFLVAGLFKLFGVKYIFDHHDLAPESYVAKFKRKGILYKLLLLMEKMNFKTSDAVVSTNNSYKTVAMKRGGKNSRNIFVVRNGPRLDTIFFPPKNPKWKDGFDYLVAYVGIIGTQDQIDVLLRIIDCLVTERKVMNIKFIIIGSGSNLENIVQMAKKMKLEHYIEFTGYIPYGRLLFEILVTADVCVNPEFSNDFTDKSTMIKIMEYMTFGKPIIQFENTEGRVSAGNASIYVKDNTVQAFADHLIDLIQDSGKRKKMGKVGEQRIRDFLQWDLQKIELKKAYRFLFSE